MGEDAGDDQEMRIFNRIVRMSSDGVRYESDPRHAELIIKSLGLDSATPVSTPGVKDFDPDYDAAKNDDMENHQVVMSTHRKPAVVRFATKPSVRHVVPYSEVYGQHPCRLIPTRHGKFKVVSKDLDAFTGNNAAVMARRRSELNCSWKYEVINTERVKWISHFLTRNNPWDHDDCDEEVSPITAAVRTPPAHNKWQQKRLGAKKVKQLEKLSSEAHTLNSQDATMFRAVSARANYLSQDRPDIAFACKELCQDFAVPTKESYCKLKRLGRYLLGTPRLTWFYPWQSLPDKVDVFVDTDFAGCRATRRSTSGGVALMGGHCVRHWSKTQPTIALSSGEAELGGLAKGSAEGIGLCTVATDLGFRLKPCIHSDATAAIGIAKRRGVGKIRHLSTADLWIQERQREGDLEIAKVLGTENPGDALTKYVERI